MKRISLPTSTATFLCCLVGALLGAGGYTFREGEGLAYLGSESKACANCHIMRDQYDGWQKSSHHAAATCNDCHVPQGLVPKYLTKGENGFEHSKAFTLQNFHEPILIKPKSARIVQKNCMRCHGVVVSEMLTKEQGSVEPFKCARCHDRVGHGPTR
ncbi:MAG TPA: cytochrome c nitrite reductase small subunit [Kiritimatiellia bacterium]|nr:cytochrome c nitrite reductase small subunit [Kiritimatiellia bacterium]HPS08555.1 cytochrome c nitrite reductase small subunit [Kiritimatiellia bacterium]